jgi:nucleoside-diphosphate-sugar epimerase
MYSNRVFLAGASGAIGRRLVPQLVNAGFVVFGTTRKLQNAREIEELGASPVVVDVFDYPALASALKAAQPGTVMHQLTDLPQTLTGALSEQALRSNARLRDEGTRKLVEAAIGAGAQRLIAQSLAWVYAPGPEPHTEEHPLDLEAQGAAAITMAGVVALERLTLDSPPLRGVVLRYGQLYGPGTWNTAQSGPVPVHVDAAAFAALLAARSDRVGIFNIVEERGKVSAEKARRELGWEAAFRL